MIYLDEPFKIPSDHPTAPQVFKGRSSSHLMADTEEELREYARKLGLKQSWIQYPGTYRVHFDLTGKYLEQAIKDSMIDLVFFVTPRELVEIYLRRRSSEH